RRDVADHHAARRAGEAAIGEECDLLAHALSVDEGGDAEHLAHPRSAFRPFVADHQYFARLVSAPLHHLGAGFLRIENPRRALEQQRLQPGYLDERATGREVAFENHDASGLHDRFMFDDFSVWVAAVHQLIFERLTRERQAIAVQRAALEQRLEHDINTARGVQVL